MDIVKFDHLNEALNNIDLEILEHGCFTGGADWRFRSMGSPFNRLYFILDGEAYIKSSSEKVMLLPGKVYFIPLNSVYDYYCEKHMVQFYVHFRINLFSMLNIFSPFSRCISLPFGRRDAERFVEYASSGTICDVLRCKSVLYGIVSGLIGEFSETTVQAVRTAMKYKELDGFLKANCQAGISAKDAARFLGVSESSLKRDFKADTGITLKQYIVNTVMQSAREMLSLTNLRIKEIAYQLGFSDEFYFSRCFSKSTGMPPSVYREMNGI